MPEWLVERGIGETRSVRIDGGEITESRILLHGAVAAGTVLDARLTEVGQGGRNAVVSAGSEEFLLPLAPRGISEGAQLSIEVTRERIPGSEPWKRPLARIADAEPTRRPALAGRELAFPAQRDELEEAGWSDLLDEARSGTVRFDGGELRISPTPAMTLIDVDGHLPQAELAMAGALAAARAILRHAIGGSIGIDLPTVAGKAQRQAIAESIDALLPQPFERTAVNGFGFLQVVRPRRHASLLELAADRAGFEARALLRRAARETGAVRIAAHPAVIRLLETKPEWLEALARQVGGAVGLRADPARAIFAGHAEQA